MNPDIAIGKAVFAEGKCRTIAYKETAISKNIVRHHRRDPIELLTQSFLDGPLELVKSLPFKQGFVPLLALFIMSRPALIATGVIVAASSAFIASDGLPSIRESFMGLVSLCLAIASAHIFNDFCDADIDRFYRRTQLRPLVLGFLEKKTACSLAHQKQGTCPRSSAGRARHS